MPSTSILEATLDLLDTLDELDVDSITTHHATPSRGIDSRSQIRFFKSRKGVVKAFMTSASGLKKRIHGAVSLVSFFQIVMIDVLIQWVAARYARVEEPEGAGKHKQQSPRPPARECGRQ